MKIRSLHPSFVLAWAAAFSEGFMALGCATGVTEDIEYISVDSGGGETTGDAGHAGFAGAAGSDGGDLDGGQDVENETSTFDVTPEDGSLPEGETILFAHDKNELFTVNPEDTHLSIKKVGTFDCIGENGEPSMTDIAVDRDGKLYGVSSKALFLDMKIEGNTVKCKQSKVSIVEGSLGSNARFYGLSMAPPTPNLGTEETLIGANTIGELYLINRTTGVLTPVGRFGTVPSNDGRGHSYPTKHVGKNWALSGDLVFLENKGSPIGFATLRDCEDPAKAPNGCSSVDTLVEIDVTKLKPGALPEVTKSIRGQILPNGCSQETCSYGSIYGVAAFNNQVYGFVYKRGDTPQEASGSLIAIDNDTGAAQLISSPLNGDGFAGAGVTTLAPVIAPPPK